MTDAWRSPPEPIAQILDAPAFPATLISPDHRWLVELDYSDLLPIAKLAEPQVSIAGFCLNSSTNGPARQNFYRRITLRDLAATVEQVAPEQVAPEQVAPEQVVQLPDEAQIADLRWSPDSRHLAFTLVQPTGYELWVLETASGQARRLTAPILNSAYGDAYHWFGEDALLCKVIPHDRGDAPEAPPVPTGPIVQENLGGKHPNRTFTNLLQNPHDELLFEYYVRSNLEVVTLSGEQLPLGVSGLIESAVPSPDRQFFLLFQLHRPFSYQLPAGYFPLLVQVYNRAGQLVHQVTDRPLTDYLSPKRDAVAIGPRNIAWRSDRPATLVWVEALDNGDPTQEVPYRDALLELDAPFSGEARLLWKTAYRFQRVAWGREDVALAWERWYDTRQIRMWRLYPNQPEVAPKLLLERSTDDQYRSPGLPITQPGPYGRFVMHFTPDEEGVYFTGRGASPQGVHPFLDRLNFATGETERLWQCRDPHFETIVQVLDPEAKMLLTRRQSQMEPPNLFLRTRRDASSIALTDYPDPAPQLAGIHKELVQYRRADGVQLSANLYLPAGYEVDRDGPLPTLLWVYPEEFKSAEYAGQVTTAENTFSRPRRASVLFLLTQGYAVFDNPKLPIIGEGDAEPNDSYVEQLIAGADAAVEYLVKRGIARRDRLGIGGHSYGAFTTANLLAHTDLFQMGIARSGAYNRTLTPFGFQGEQRTFWEAADTYMQMSPFTHAAQIQAPLLLIHGADDNNSGTFPMQTKRLYEALKGLGAIVRWVKLPLEAHGYSSREAVGHVLWEMVTWCDRYLKGTGG